MPTIQCPLCGYAFSPNPEASRRFPSRTRLEATEPLGLERILEGQSTYDDLDDGVPSFDHTDQFDPYLDFEEE